MTHRACGNDLLITTFLTKAIVGEVIDALIPAEAIDQAEALAKAEEDGRVPWLS